MTSMKCDEFEIWPVFKWWFWCTNNSEEHELGTDLTCYPMGWGLGIAQWRIYKSSIENSNFYLILDNSLENFVKFWKFNSTVRAKPGEKV